MPGHPGNYPGLHGHGGYQYGPSGPVGLLELLAPLLVLALLLTLFMAGRWVGHEVEALRTRRGLAAASRQAARDAALAQPVLASESERERVLERVSQAIGEGRLSFEEGDRRIDGVLRSRHRHELERLVADLPALAPRPHDALVPSAPLRRGLLGAAAVVVLAALVVQAVVEMWVLWPVAIASVAAVALLPRR